VFWDTARGRDAGSVLLSRPVSCGVRDRSCQVDGPALVAQFRVREAPRLDAERGINDGREAVGPVIAAACGAADARAVPADHQPVAVVLDLVNPQRAGRW
jgi:hypothetical protein